MLAPQTILGIDPGTNIMGFGVLCVEGSKLEVLDLGTFSLLKIKDPYQKMASILEQMYRLLDTYQPQLMAIEAPFYGKNVQSMLKLGRAQGIAIAAALSRGVEVTEYAPRKIKLAITGKGGASKEQVALMLQQTLHFGARPAAYPLDATDALAVAVCHAYQSKMPAKGSAQSWKAFLAKNPDRLARP